jgi:hypothetical protein
VRSARSKIASHTREQRRIAVVALRTTSDGSNRARPRARGQAPVAAGKADSALSAAAILRRRASSTSRAENRRRLSGLVGRRSGPGCPRRCIHRRTVPGPIVMGQTSDGRRRGSRHGASCREGPPCALRQSPAEAGVTAAGADAKQVAAAERIVHEVRTVALQPNVG